MNTRKKGEKMNEKSTITMLKLETGEIINFSGYWSWQEIYRIIRDYEKSGKWKIQKVEKKI